MSKIKTDIVDITPKLAEEMLTKNTDNRDIRQAGVDRYVRIIQKGEWMLTHQGIAFDVNDKLMDGQHRLMAIARAGVTVKMMVTRGLPVDAFTVLDQGVKRNAADVLHVPARIAEVCNLAARLYTHEMSPTPQSLQKMIKVVGPLAEELQKASASKTVFFSSAAWRLGAIARMLLGEEKTYILNLYAKLCAGDTGNLPPIGHAIVKIRLRGAANATSKIDTIAQSLYVFDWRNTDYKQVRHDSSDTGDTVRGVLKAALIAIGE